MVKPSNIQSSYCELQTQSPFLEKDHKNDVPASIQTLFLITTFDHLQWFCGQYSYYLIHNPFQETHMNHTPIVGHLPRPNHSLDDISFRLTIMHYPTLGVFSITRVSCSHRMDNDLKFEYTPTILFKRTTSWSSRSNTP